MLVEQCCCASLDNVPTKGQAGHEGHAGYEDQTQDAHFLGETRPSAQCECECESTFAHPPQEPVFFTHCAPPVYFPSRVSSQISEFGSLAGTSEEGGRPPGLARVPLNTGFSSAGRILSHDGNARRCSGRRPLGGGGFHHFFYRPPQASSPLSSHQALFLTYSLYRATTSTPHRKG